MADSMADETIVGIDLGTTNSEVAVYRNGAIEVIDLEGEQIMPSVVSLSPDGSLIVGTAAKNQAILYPERTAISIKRRMGSDESVSLGDKFFKPQEISAMILRELKVRAEKFLGYPVKKAVITVPAFFSDAQRQATRDAGVIAGFEVMRILNEPTAASLAYESDKTKNRIVLVYDLGGGTFDVSIVEAHGDATEVLASHGDTRLGGDDFDRLLLNDVIEEFIRQGNPDPRNTRLALGRLTQAIVRAKHELSFKPYTRIREENLLERDGVPLHMDMEISRQRYEDLIKPLVEKSFESVHKALNDSGKKADELDAVLLVGGMTRTPLVIRRLAEVLEKLPRTDVHPDLAVAMGAGILASRLGGHDDGRVLVDITPYSFGPEAATMGDFGIPIADRYAPIIKKGTPLPANETEEFATLCNNQEKWEVNVFQGENPIASRNIRIGQFIADGFSKVPAGNKVLCTFELDLNGILNVTVVEKLTGLSKRVRIENALGAMAKDDMKKARENLDSFFAAPPELSENLPENLSDDLPDGSTELATQSTKPLEIEAGAVSPAGTTVLAGLRHPARTLLEKAEARLEGMKEKDRSDVLALITRIRADITDGDNKDLPAAMAELDDLLYFLD